MVCAVCACVLRVVAECAWSGCFYLRRTLRSFSRVASIDGVLYAALVHVVTSKVKKNGFSRMCTRVSPRPQIHRFDHMWREHAIYANPPPHLLTLRHTSSSPTPHLIPPHPNPPDHPNPPITLHHPNRPHQARRRSQRPSTSWLKPNLPTRAPHKPPSRLTPLTLTHTSPQAPHPNPSLTPTPPPQRARRRSQRPSTSWLKLSSCRACAAFA